MPAPARRGAVLAAAPAAALPVPAALVRAQGRHPRSDDASGHGGWRERSAASWLIAVGRRADLRDRIARDLHSGTACGYGWDYCTALARLGTEQDAELLRRYLDQALLVPRPVDEDDHRHCRRRAMGALLFLDGVLGTSRAQPLLAPGGLWEQWSGEEGTDSLAEERESVAQLVAFAAGRRPQIRT
ncbi:DUF6000 family protein [Streptomyces sp. NPDC087270]|uniref:DUF6000 family protein n=1 Tax=Streptomyces sp. NPDC087270 TaxID=3365774 RepID=UPI0037F94A43